MLVLSLLAAFILPAQSYEKSLLRQRTQAHESRPSPPPGYTLAGAASPDTMLTLRLALVQNDYEGLISALTNVSTPEHDQYGVHLSVEELEKYIAPSFAHTSAVAAWLSENELQATNLSSAGDWISVQMPVSQANDLFSAEFSVFTQTATGNQVVRTLAYSIPPHLDGALFLVHPTVTFPDPQGYMIPNITLSASGLATTNTTADCDITLITPSCLQSLYGIPTTPAKDSSNRLAVTGYLEQWPQEADLEAFLAKNRPDIDPTTNWTLVTLDGGSDPQSPSDAGVEANLDTQYTIGLATNVPVTFISVGEDVANTTNGDDEFAEVLLDTALYMLGLPNPPQVMTTSYGDEEQYISKLYAYALCAAYAGLGARGVSVIFASGDGGVSGLHSASGTCTTFVPTFPSGCPFLTSVGGTYGIPETAVSFSSGGFSNYFPLFSAWYQIPAVEQYLINLGDTNKGLFNPSGRGFPDVAAYAVDYNIVVGGENGAVSGTSCASPTFASIISLLNDELISSGQSSLGFLNPWLYGAARSALNDITTGNNYACSNFTTGFNATTGWDPVTGLGTPSYTQLREALQKRSKYNSNEVTLLNNFWHGV